MKEARDHNQDVQMNRINKQSYNIMILEVDIKEKKEMG